MYLCSTRFLTFCRNRTSRCFRHIMLRRTHMNPLYTPFASMSNASHLWRLLYFYSSICTLLYSYTDVHLVVCHFYLVWFDQWILFILFFVLFTNAKKKLYEESLFFFWSLFFSIGCFSMAQIIKEGYITINEEITNEFVKKWFKLSIIDDLPVIQIYNTQKVFGSLVHPPYHHSNHFHSSQPKQIPHPYFVSSISLDVLSVTKRRSWTLRVPQLRNTA